MGEAPLGVLLAALLPRAGGGMVKTVGLFREALAADVVTFGAESEHSAFRAGDQLSAVPSRLPVLRQYGYVPRRHRGDMDAVARRARLISCHAFYRWHVVWVRSVSSRYGTPYWMVPHGVLDPYVMRRNQAAKRWFLSRHGRAFLAGAKRIVFATRAEEEKARMQFDLPESSLLYWPVEVPDLAGASAQRQRFRTRHSIAEADRVLLHFGRLHPMKRTLETIDVFCDAVGNAPGTRLLVAGVEHGITLDECRVRAARRGACNITILGPQFGTDRSALLAASDGYISLSHRENFNHSAAESLAAGLPTVLSPGNDIGYDLQGAGCSWRIAEWSHGAAVRAVQEFFGTPRDEVRAMGARGRQWVAANLGFETFRAKLRALARIDSN